MTIDASVYRAALDLSKPAPTSLEHLATATAGTGQGGGPAGPGDPRPRPRPGDRSRGSALAAQWLDPLSDRLKSAPLLRRLHHPGWSLAATAASFLFAYLRRGRSLTGIVAYTAGVVVIALLAVGARVTLARRLRVAITQESWSPAVRARRRGTPRCCRSDRSTAPSSARRGFWPRQASWGRGGPACTAPGRPAAYLPFSQRIILKEYRAIITGGDVVTIGHRGG